MKKLSIFTVSMFAVGLFMVPATFASPDRAGSRDTQSGQSDFQRDQQRQSQTQQGQQLQQQQQQQSLLLADNLSGIEVQNQQGEKIGDIDKILVDVEKGQIGFVTVTGGGVLGFGKDKYIVPFNALQMKMPQDAQARAGERQQGKVIFTLNTPIEQLREVPQGDIEQVLTQDQSRQIHEHYGVSPYWEGTQRQQRQDDTQRQQLRQDDPQRQMMQDNKMDKKDQKDKQRNY